MGNKTSETLRGLCTVAGGILLAVAIIDEATDKIMPQLEKLTQEEVKSLPQFQEPSPPSQQEKHENKESETTITKEQLEKIAKMIQQEDKPHE